MIHAEEEFRFILLLFAPNAVSLLKTIFTLRKTGTSAVTRFHGERLSPILYRERLHDLKTIDATPSTRKSSRPSITDYNLEFRLLSFPFFFFYVQYFSLSQGMKRKMKKFVLIAFKCYVIYVSRFNRFFFL